MSGQVANVFAVELLRSTSADNDGVDNVVDLRSRDIAATQDSSLCTISPRCRVILASAVAAVGGVLFGYDTGTARRIRIGALAPQKMFQGKGDVERGKASLPFSLVWHHNSVNFSIYHISR